MSRIIFDIETLGFPLESFDSETQTYLLRFADSDEKIEDVKKNLNLHPSPPKFSVWRSIIRTRKKEKYSFNPIRTRSIFQRTNDVNSFRLPKNKFSIIFGPSFQNTTNS